jgi:primase-polymerase (primpol)-like protein
MKEHLSTFQYAETLEQQFERGVLSELTDYPNFVLWKAVPVQGKIKKIPLSPVSHTPASVTNPETWGTLEQALKSLKSGKGNGIGFVFSDDDPFTGIDIDSCIVANKLTPQASELVTDFWSYTELSPSHTGLHILVQGTVPAGRRKDGIEMYSTGRYFTITTNHLKIAPDTIENRQPQLDTLYASLTTQEAHRQTIQPQEYQIYVSDDTVLKKAENAPNGEDFTSLFNGNIAGFTSKSNADWQLVLRLGYWTNWDAGQMRRLFLRSKLVDNKTLRPTNGSTYLDETINNAVENHWKI